MILGGRDHSTPIREALEEWESHSFWCFVLHTPRFTPLSLVLISASVSRTNSSFCLWLSLTAPVLVLAHGLLFLDGSALGISLIFDEASDVLKSMLCFRCSGRSSRVCLPPHCPDWTQHSSRSAGTAMHGSVHLPCLKGTPESVFKSLHLYYPGLVHGVA